MERVLKKRAAHNHLSSLTVSVVLSIFFPRLKGFRIHRFTAKRMKISSLEKAFREKNIVEQMQKE